MQSLNLKTPTNSQSSQFFSGKSYDLAIVGAGVSSAYTLIHYIAQLEQQSSGERADVRPTKIVVTEKVGNFWTGIPYGDRSGCHALLISPFHEFMPQQPEREQFVNWLNANRDDLFAPEKYQHGTLAHIWLQANIADINAGNWDDLFIPRYIFGQYIQQHVATIIADATAKGSIEIDLVTAEVFDIQRLPDDRFQVDIALAAEDNSYLFTNKLVIAIGSPPNIAFEHPQTNDLCYIDNMYEPSLDVNITRICDSLKTADPSRRQLAIVGSNAGTLDTLFGLNNSPELTILVDKFIILSPNAAFPHRINREIVPVEYSPEQTIALAQTSSFTAKQIFEAVQLDVASASAQNINISDVFTDITKAVMTAMNLLSYDEQKQFVSIYAVEIGKLQRRAGGEYLDVVEGLIAEDKLELIKGKFKGYSSDLGCEYMASETQQLATLNAPLGVIINCAGFQDVTKSSSRLIQNLIRREICLPNDSKRGFAIDKNYKASKNCYLMGPLVAGNIDGNFKIWHAESCQRIINLSKQLAEVLIQPEPLAVIPTVTVSSTKAVELLAT